MKVLVSAVACDPDGVSEGFVGWQAVSALAKEHDVWVITTPRYRANIERSVRSGRASGRLQFHYHCGFGKWTSSGFVTRVQAWLEYVCWSRTLLPLARKLHAKIHFDITHHVTYSAWRVPSSLWRLGPPFVWGPLGGGGDVPFRFLSMMSMQSMLFESARKCARLSAWLPGGRRCARGAAWVLASNGETARLLASMRGSEDAISQMCPSYLAEVQLRRFESKWIEQKPSGPFRIFAGGTLLGSKGIALALHGLRDAAARGVRFLYTIASLGPETAHLRGLAQKLGIGERVRFVGRYEGDEYLQELWRSHCFLLPSFRENLGLTMVEAMLARAVPMVVDVSAPGEIVTAACGVKIPLGDPAVMASVMGSALKSLDQNRDVVAAMGEQAYLRARQIMSEDRYLDELRAVYRRVLPPRTW